MKIGRRTFLLGSQAALISSCAQSSSHSAPSVERRQGKGALLYRNALKSPSDIADFVLEGDANIAFENGEMLMSNAREPTSEDGQDANFVLWCPENFPEDIEISWDFSPIREPGLCVFFFAASGLLNGEHVHALDGRLSPRSGRYAQYVESDLSMMQVSYFRRRWESERAFHLCNLRKAPGFELLAQGPDPLPDVADVIQSYRIKVWRKSDQVRFFIDDIEILNWNGHKQQSLPRQGVIGFRQMAPLSAAYSNLEVRSTL